MNKSMRTTMRTLKVVRELFANSLLGVRLVVRLATGFRYYLYTKNEQTNTVSLHTPPIPPGCACAKRRRAGNRKCVCRVRCSFVRGSYLENSQLLRA
jgi:hypothetical protein